MKKEKQQTKLTNCKFSISIAVITLILIAINYIFFKDVHYKSGLKGNAFYALNFLMLELPLFAALIICCIVSAVNILLAVIKSFKAKNCEWSRLSLAVLPLMLTLGLYLLNFSGESKAGAWDFLRGYEVWVEKQVDTPAIRKWLANLDNKYSGQDYFEAKDFPEPLPDVITKLNPYHMYLGEFKNGRRSVTFEWGCALGHFGIVIGSPEMEIPKKEELIKHSDHDFEFRRYIEPGVYLFDRG